MMPPIRNKNNKSIESNEQTKPSNPKDEILTIPFTIGELDSLMSYFVEKDAGVNLFLNIDRKIHQARADKKEG